MSRKKYLFLPTPPKIQCEFEKIVWDFLQMHFLVYFLERKNRSYEHVEISSKKECHLCRKDN